MRLTKAIKKIAALGTTAAFIGATVLGAASAATLADYPSPFVKDGKFSAVMVVGDKAAAEDVIGVTDIATSLQYASSTTAGTSAGVTVSVEGDWPRNFTLSPNGKFMLVANQRSGNITVFRINTETGMPEFTGKEIKLPAPVCLEFL